MFTLLNFSISHRGATLYECKLGDDEKFDRLEPLTTLIIGSNGSGKSYLLAQLAEFFRALFASTNVYKSSIDSSKYECIRIVYQYAGNTYDVSREGRAWSILVNGKAATLNEVDFPNKVIALSFMTNDKFVFSPEDDPYYKYIGVRASSNSSYTSSVQKKIVTSILLCLMSPEKRESVLGILDFLGYEKKIRIEYSLVRKTLFTRPMTAEIINSRITSLNEQRRYLTDTRIKELKQNVENIVSFVNKNKKHFDVSNKKKLVYEFNLNALASEDVELKTDMLRNLEELRLISAPQLVVCKKDTFDFDSASSGEKHFFFTMLNLISSISQDALVLIDEPELSLHPAWQMKYIKYFKKILSDFKSCHCLFATHSHFMISDLEPKSSNVIILKLNDSRISHRVSEYVSYSTYAWSAENILYKVFELRTVRNFYFGQEIDELLKLISSRSENIDRMNELLSKFERIVFDKHDPINEVIAQARYYISKGRHA